MNKEVSSMCTDANLKKVFCYITEELLKILNKELFSYYDIEDSLIGDDLGRYKCLKEMHILIKNVLLDQTYSTKENASTRWTEAAFDMIKGGK